jgi:hypothetical protein
MKKSIFISLLLLVLCYKVQGQSAIAKIKWEEAELQFSEGRYFECYNKLNEVEEILGRKTPKVSHLKIISASKIIEANPYNDFNLLNNAREEAQFFLKEYENLQDYEEKYKEVYYCLEKIKKYPYTLEEFTQKKNQIEQEKKEAQRALALREEAERKSQEELIKRRNEEIRITEERELQKVDYSSMYIGYSAPHNEKSAKIISYDDWLSAVGEQPLTTALKSGKFGLTGSFSLGIEGIAGLNLLNNSFKSSRLGFGIFYGIHHSWLLYSFNDIGTTPSIHDHYFKDYSKKSFMLTSLGIGPSISYRLGKKKTFIDFHCTYNLNSFWRRDDLYSFNYEDYTSGSPAFGSTSEGYVVKEETTISFSPVFGLGFRFWESVLLSYEIRLNVIDNGNYLDHFEYSFPNSFQPYEETKTFKPKNGVDLSTRCIKLGFLF